MDIRKEDLIAVIKYYILNEPKKVIKTQRHYQDEYKIKDGILYIGFKKKYIFYRKNSEIFQGSFFIPSQKVTITDEEYDDLVNYLNNSGVKEKIGDILSKARSGKIDNILN